MRSRPGQAAVETVLAVVIVTSVFLALFRLSHLLTGKILAEHAALRVARARAVGLNRFMCLKTARVAVIPTAGERLWPRAADDSFTWENERSRVPVYLQTADESVARGVLEYEGWNHLGLSKGDATDVRVNQPLSLFGGEWKLDLVGKASIGDEAGLYLQDLGL